MTILVRPVQPSKALLPILVTESGMTMLVRPVQPLKASFPISVTESGMTMLVRPVQPLKASFPISVTELGISIFFRSVQSWKAYLPIFVTVFGMVVLAHPITNTLVLEWIIALQSFRESNVLLASETFILRRWIQPLKAYRSIFVTELGITTSVRPEQFKKLWFSISVTELGITILLSLLQL